MHLQQRRALPKRNDRKRGLTSIPCSSCSPYSLCSPSWDASSVEQEEARSCGPYPSCSWEADAAAASVVAALAEEDLEAAAASAEAGAHSVAGERLADGDMLSPADHERISAAIGEIEKRTSGDIYCIVAHEASNYREQEG